MKKCVSVLAALCITLFQLQVSAAIPLKGKAAIVTDFETGEVIYDYNADLPCVPASMTKLMTAYVFFSEMEDRGMTLDSQIYASPKAVALSLDKGLSNVPLEEGRPYTVDQLMYALFVHSGCGATLALAEAISGSESNFVMLMNSYASRLGLDAGFYDCFGLDAKNSITPRSMAELARRIITDYPVCLKYSSTTSFEWSGKTYGATNLLLPGLKYEYAGADGIKTGTTDEAGCCITATAQRNGRRIVSSLFGAPDNDSRYTDSIALLDYGFANYPAVKAFNSVKCEFTAPQNVYFNEDFTVVAQLSGLPAAMAVKAQWSVNGVPIAGGVYDKLWVRDGDKLYFNYNPSFYSGDLNITLQLFTSDSSLSFEQTVVSEAQYKPEDAPSKVILPEAEPSRTTQLQGPGPAYLPTPEDFPSLNILQLVAA